MRPRLTPLLVLSALLLAACGGDDDGAAPGSTDAKGGVTIEHAFGTTTLDEVPEVIVSLDAQWTDALLALGEAPDAYASDPNLEGGVRPWQQLPEDAEAIPFQSTLPLEAIASFEPDLILVSWQAPDEESYEALAAIAPTIPLLGERQVDHWQDQVVALGQALREEDEAQAFVQQVQAEVDALAAELPGLQGKTYAMINYVPGDSINVVADPEDGANLFFEDLGLGIDPDILDVADGVSGRAQLSLEQAGMLDADLLIAFSQGGDLTELVGWDRLPAVRSGALAVLDYGPVTALNTPSGLSLRYIMDEIRPALEAAAR